MSRGEHDFRFASPMQTVKKMLGPRVVAFLRRCVQRNPPGIERYKALLAGKKALEIGGPSELFSDQGCLPIYSVVESVDNCLFSEQTIWTGKVDDGRGFQYHPAKKAGLQFLFDGTDLQRIPNATYEGVLASHCLEHVANPLRALDEWKRVLTSDGFLLLLLPHKDGTFDWRRPTTKLEHMIQDYERNVGEDDLTHLPEILEFHDLEKDPAAGSREQFKQRCLDNKRTRAMHHHVFDTRTAAALLDHAGFQFIRVAAIKPFHIIILAQKCEGQRNNECFFRPDAEFLAQSPFLSDREPPSREKIAA
jgi:SAM-dependent methyltransferase